MAAATMAMMRMTSSQLVIDALGEGCRPRLSARRAREPLSIEGPGPHVVHTIIEVFGVQLERPGGRSDGLLPGASIDLYGDVRNAYLWIRMEGPTPETTIPSTVAPSSGSSMLTDTIGISTQIGPDSE